MTRIFIRCTYHTRRWSLQTFTFEPQHPIVGRVGRDSNAKYGRCCTKHRHALTMFMLDLAYCAQEEAAALSFFCTACRFFKVVVTRIFIRCTYHTRRWSLQTFTFEPQHPNSAAAGGKRNNRPASAVSVWHSHLLRH